MVLTHMLRAEHRLNKLIIENRYPAPFKRLYGLLRSYTAIAIYRSRFLPVQASPAYIIATVLSKGDYYMDIGAAEGHLMTLASRAAGKLGRVYAFEPRENAFCHLKLLVAAYGLDNVILCQSLVGAYDGECQLFECLDHPTSSSISSKWAGGFSKTYPMITIDTWAQEKSTRSMDLVKIDVEGAEMHVLKGGLKFLQSIQPMIIMEVRDPDIRSQLFGYDVEDLMKVLRSIGYARFYSLRRSGLVEIQSKTDILPSDKDMICVVPDKPYHEGALKKLLIV